MLINQEDKWGNKMKKINRIGAAMLLATFAANPFGGVIMAHAAEAVPISSIESQETNIPSFVDVKEGDPFYESIMAAREAGYVGGIGNNTFGADLPLRICDFRSILKTAFDIYSPLMTAEDIKAVMEIDLRDYNNDVTQPLTVKGFFTSLFCLYGIPTNKVEQNPNGILGVASDLGLLARELNEDDLVTRKDAIYAFMVLKNGQYKYLCEKQVGEIDMKTKSGEDTDLYLYYGRLAMVPESVLKQFIKDGWKIIVTDSDLYGNGVKAAGITNYDSKTITVNDSYAIVHEMGHYFDDFLNQESKVYELFKAEKDAAAEMIRDYTKTNQKEFFADMFTYWLEDTILGGTREIMKEKTPLTYAYFEELDKTYHFDNLFAYTHEMRPVYDSPFHS